MSNVFNVGNVVKELIWTRMDGSTLPADGLIGGQVSLYYHLEDFENVLAVLSKEKVVSLFFNGSGPGFENGITTGAENLGT
jgi:hypothetical protein